MRFFGVPGGVKQGFHAIIHGIIHAIRYAMRLAIYSPYCENIANNPVVVFRLAVVARLILQF